MNKNFKRIILAVLSVMMVLTALTSCNMGLPWDIEVWGAWESDNSALGVENSVTTITNKTLTVDNPAEWSWDYSGEIVEFDNSSYNLAEENPTSGDFGSLIVKITAHESEYGQDQIGKYTVIRWKELTSTGMEYSESASQFTTLEEAKTAGSDNFTIFSSLTKSEE